MLRELRSRNDDLSTRHVIVRQKHDLKQGADILVVVDHMRDPIAKLDDHFSVVVAWRRLAADHYDPRHELFRTFADRCIFDRYVAMHDVQNV